MFRLLGKIPQRCIVAFSGGVDSVVATDFLLNGRKDVSIAFFHHGTGASDAGEAFAVKFAESREITLHVGRISSARPPRVSQEEHWRNERYAFLHSFDLPVVTAHHLDDAVETWIFSSLHGSPKLIPYANRNVVRPFLPTPKSEIIAWAERRGLQWVEDPSNCDTSYMRNLIRHRIVPEALRVNPGLRSVVQKKYLKKT